MYACQFSPSTLLPSPPLTHTLFSLPPSHTHSLSPYLSLLNPLSLSPPLLALFFLPFCLSLSMLPPPLSHEQYTPWSTYPSRSGEALRFILLIIDHIKVLCVHVTLQLWHHRRHLTTNVVPSPCVIPEPRVTLDFI